MTVRTYTTSPNSASFIRRLSTGFARPELPYFTRTTDAYACGFQTLTKNDQHVHGFQRYDFGLDSGLNIPARSLITRAYLRVFANGNQSDAASDIDLSLVAKDGVWDPSIASAGAGNPFSTNAAIWDSQGTGGVVRGFVTVRDTGATAQAAVGGGADAAWRVNTQLLDASLVLAQAINHTTTFTLGSVDFRCRRVGTHAGNVNVTVHPLIGNVLDSTVTLATSDNVAFNSLPTAFGTVNFPFSGINQIGISSGNARGYRITDPTGVGTNPAVEVSASAPGFSATPLQAFQRGGYPYAFSEVNYSIDGMMPLLYEADNSTIRVAPHGSIVRVASWPTFVNNTWYEIEPSGFKYLIQEWVNDPAYVTGSTIAVQFSPSSSTEVPTVRTWDDTELIVEYREPGYDLL